MELTWLQRLFPPARIRLETEQREATERFEVEHSNWQSAKARFEAAEQSRLEVRRQSLEGEPGAMAKVLESILAAIDWPLETAVDFVVADDGRGLALDVDLPEIEDLPHQRATAEALGLGITPLADDQRRRHYAAHVHGVLFRVMGEVFSALPTVDIVIASGYSQRLRQATGHIQDDYLLSAAMTRRAWSAINFKGLTQVDPAATLAELSNSVVSAPAPDGTLATNAPQPPDFRATAPGITPTPAQAPSTAPEPQGAPPSPAPGVGSAANPAAVVLVPGANTALALGPEDQPLVLGLSWAPADYPGGLDISGFLLDAERRVRSGEDFVFHNRPTSADGALSLTGREGGQPGLDHRAQGGSLHLALGKLSRDIQRIAVALSLANPQGPGPTLGQLHEVCLTLAQGGQALARCDIPLGGRPETALVVAEVYRRQGQWKCRCVGQGFTEGLAALAQHYGVETTR